MDKKIKFDLYRALALMSDEEVKQEFFDYSFRVLGSTSELMYERGYPIEDIREAEKVERFNNEYYDMLEMVVLSRKIKID